MTEYFNQSPAHTSPEAFAVGTFSKPSIGVCPLAAGRLTSLTLTARNKQHQRSAL